MKPQFRGARILWLGIYAILFVAFAGCPVTGPPEGGGPEDPGNDDPTPVPAIQLWRDGNPLFQGYTCEFGLVCINTSCEITFTIENAGTAELNLTGVPDKVETSGAEASMFTIASQPSSPIAPCESSSFTVRFSTDSSGNKAATVSIASDDPYSSPYTFTVTAVGLVPPAKVPATGQATSYGLGDDGDLQMGVSWPSPRFIDNADETVTDALTGLMWEKDPGTGATWNVAVTRGNNLTLGGHPDWRLANVHELQSLVNAGSSNPTAWLVSQGFTGVPADDYWSSTTSATNSTMAFVMRLDEGGVMGRTTKGILNPEYPWIVRDGQAGVVALPKTGQSSWFATGDDGDLEKGASWPAPRFRDNGNGTITDNLTGLVWEKSPSPTKRTWPDALTYANDLTIGEYSDWRLPNKNELRSLIHYGYSNSASWLVGQGFVGIHTDNYWTSTTFAPDTGLAWVVYMETGNMGYMGGKTTSSYYVWAVRGGQ
jgi:hypothetical protein